MSQFFRFPLGTLVVVLIKILTAYSAPTKFYFFSSITNINGELIQFQAAPYPFNVNCLKGKLLPKSWNLDWPVCLLVHGCFEDVTKPTATSLWVKEALLKKGRQCNIVVVDWYMDAGFGEPKTDWNQIAPGNYATDDFNVITVNIAHYNAVTENVPKVGNEIKGFITWIRKTVSNPKLNITAIVHSMGSQVIAIASDALLDKKEENIHTIISTDPPSRNSDGPGSSKIVHQNYLSKASADLVIIIKTNAGGFGSHCVDGHIIFYINNEYKLIHRSPDDDAADYDLATDQNGVLLKWLQVQPGFMKQRAGADTLLYSHNLAAKFLADQIVKSETLTVSYYDNMQITLLGENINPKVLDKYTDGLLIKLSWKQLGPQVVAKDYAELAELESIPPKFTNAPKDITVVARVTTVHTLGECSHWISMPTNIAHDAEKAKVISNQLNLLTSK